MDIVLHEMTITIFPWWKRFYAAYEMLMFGSHTCKGQIASLKDSK